MSTRVMKLELEKDLCRELRAKSSRLALGAVEGRCASPPFWLGQGKAEIGKRDTELALFRQPGLDELNASKS